MLKINTKDYKPIEFEIDGIIYKTKKIVNRILMGVLKLNDRMQKAEPGSLEQYECMIDILDLYTPLEKEFIIDNFDPDDMEKIISDITKKLIPETPEEKKEGEEKEGEKEEFPLAGGASGEEPLKS